VDGLVKETSKFSPASNPDLARQRAAPPLGKTGRGRLAHDEHGEQAMGRPIGFADHRSKREGRWASGTAVEP